MSNPRYKTKRTKPSEQSCPLGFEQHATKREAEQAAKGRPVARCGRCRKWHVR